MESSNLQKQLQYNSANWHSIFNKNTKFKKIDHNAFSSSANHKMRLQCTIIEPQKQSQWPRAQQEWPKSNLLQVQLQCKLQTYIKASALKTCKSESNAALKLTKVGKTNHWLADVTAEKSRICQEWLQCNAMTCKWNLNDLQGVVRATTATSCK